MALKSSMSLGCDEASDAAALTRGFHNAPRSSGVKFEDFLAALLNDAVREETVEEVSVEEEER